jgi:hypothetical protein
MVVRNMTGSVLKRVARPLAVVAATAALAAAGVAVDATAASASRTPKYHMDCYTWTDKSASGYYGAANCFNGTAYPAVWQVVGTCKFGFSFESDIVGTDPGEVRTVTAGNCWWGVASVSVKEI